MKKWAFLSSEIYFEVKTAKYTVSFFTRKTCYKSYIRPLRRENFTGKYFYTQRLLYTEPFNINPHFFPRASERRVLLIVGVWHFQIFTSSHNILKSSHLLIFTSSHLIIFSSSHLHIFLLIFTSSHLHTSSFSPSHFHTSSFSPSHLHIFTSSHLHILTSSHLHILSCPLALLPSSSLLLFYFSLEGAGQCQRDGPKRNFFARNEVRSPKTEVKLRFHASGRNPFARNEVPSRKAEVKLRFAKRPAQPFRFCV